MARTNSVADSVSISIKCPKCGEKTEKVLSWLVDENFMPCPGCGRGVNLKAGDNARRIEKMSREAARVQATLTKAGD